MKLTIAIPTLNRPDCLSEAIDSVLKNMHDQVDILISDNASTDNTKEIVECYQKKHPGLITYVQHPENIGYDRNIDSLFKNAQGDHIWILCDDDALTEQSIKTVLDILNKHPSLDVIFSNYTECDNQLKEVSPRIREDIHENALCTNGDDFIAKSKTLFGLTSSLIIKKEAWLMAPLERHMESGWIHVAAVFEILAKSTATSFVIANQLLLFRMDNANWCYGPKIYFTGEQLMHVIRSLKNLNYKPATYQNFLNRHYRSLATTLPSIFRHKVSLAEKIKVAKDIASTYPTKLRTWLFYIPLCICPRFILQAAYTAYKVKR